MWVCDHEQICRTRRRGTELVGRGVEAVGSLGRLGRRAQDRMADDCVCGRPACPIEIDSSRPGQGGATNRVPVIDTTVAGEGRSLRRYRTTDTRVKIGIDSPVRIVKSRTRERRDGLACKVFRKRERERITDVGLKSPALR